MAPGGIGARKKAVPAWNGFSIPKTFGMQANHGVIRWVTASPPVDRPRRSEGDHQASTSGGLEEEIVVGGAIVQVVEAAAVVTVEVVVVV